MRVYIIAKRNQNASVKRELAFDTDLYQKFKSERDSQVKANNNCTSKNSQHQSGGANQSFKVNCQWQ